MRRWSIRPPACSTSALDRARCCWRRCRSGPGPKGSASMRAQGLWRSPRPMHARWRMADRTRFVLRDWNRAGWHDGLGAFDLVLANPPYVEADAALDRSVHAFEPAEALFAGADGLDAYRVLLPTLETMLVPSGTALFEIGHTQGEAVSALARQAGFAATQHRDPRRAGPGGGAAPSRQSRLNALDRRGGWQAPRDPLPPGARPAARPWPACPAPFRQDRPVSSRGTRCARGSASKRRIRDR